MTLNRFAEPGWEAIHVPDTRRGLWMRRVSSSVEFCAGREGDDAYVALQVGQTLDAETLAALAEVIETYQYALEMAEAYRDELAAERCENCAWWRSSEGSSAAVCMKPGSYLYQTATVFHYYCPHFAKKEPTP